MYEHIGTVSTGRIELINIILDKGLLLLLLRPISRTGCPSEPIFGASEIPEERVLYLGL